jgi:YidC/Oxa1 family membrane protein insertase
VIDTLLTPLYYGVTALLLGWRWVFSHLGLNPNSGATWALSIVGLVVVIRIILIPLFVKQINASRKMVALQPKMKALQEKHKGDRERLSQETMKLYKEEKANPLASCLPLLLQSPVFFALFRTLDGAAKIKNGHLTPHGLLTQSLADSLNHATLFGAGLSATFTHSGGSTRAITIVLIVLMSATTFITQRQLSRKNMPAAALTGPMAQQQKLLLYGYPLFFAVTGINFPIGVLLYWLTTNLWTMGQQYYVIKRNPTPGSPAWDEFQAKRRAQGLAERDAGSGPAVVADAPPVVVRQQPRKTTRSQRGGVLSPATADGPSVAPQLSKPIPKQGAPRTGPPRTGAPRPGVPRTGVPRTSVPRAGAPKTGAPKPPVTRAAGGGPSGATRVGAPKQPLSKRPTGGAQAARRPDDNGTSAPRTPR